jgi:hypothetical protein
VAVVATQGKQIEDFVRRLRLVVLQSLVLVLEYYHGIMI